MNKITNPVAKIEMTDVIEQNKILLSTICFGLTEPNTLSPAPVFNEKVKVIFANFALFCSAILINLFSVSTSV